MISSLCFRLGGSDPSFDLLLLVVMLFVSQLVMFAFEGHLSLVAAVSSLTLASPIQLLSSSLIGCWFGFVYLLFLNFYDENTIICCCYCRF